MTWEEPSRVGMGRRSLRDSNPTTESPLLPPRILTQLLGLGGVSVTQLLEIC